MRHDDSLFASKFFIYLLLGFAYKWVAWHIPPLIPFCTISSISTSVSNSNATSAFFKYAYYGKPGPDKKYVGSSSYISMHLLRKFITFANSSVSLRSYRYYDTYLNFVFWNAPRLFSRVCGQRLWYFRLSDSWKILSCLAMTFHWIFANYPDTHMAKHQI